MTPKETIKNALREKLKNLDKEELINIIAELSAEYVMVRSMRRHVVLSGETECSQLLRDDLQKIVDETKSSMPVHKPSIFSMINGTRTIKEE